MIYRHYKGGAYRTIGTASHTETEEKLVIYQSVEDGRMWARPHGMFYGEVAVNGEWVQRFLLEDEEGGDE